MSFLEALESATAQDLEAVDQQIVTLKKKIDGLQAAKRVLSARLNGAVSNSPARASPKGGDSVRSKILKYLKSAGASSVAAIAAGIDAEPKNLYVPLNHEWFKKLGDSWTLTDLGRVAK